MVRGCCTRVWDASESAHASNMGPLKYPRLLLTVRWFKSFFHRMAQTVRSSKWEAGQITCLLRLHAPLLLITTGGYVSDSSLSSGATSWLNLHPLNGFAEHLWVLMTFFVFWHQHQLQTCGSTWKIIIKMYFNSFMLHWSCVGGLWDWNSKVNDSNSGFTCKRSGNHLFECVCAFSSY